MNKKGEPGKRQKRRADAAAKAGRATARPEIGCPAPARKGRVASPI